MLRSLVCVVALCVTASSSAVAQRVPTSYDTATANAIKVSRDSTRCVTAPKAAADQCVRSRIRLDSIRAGLMCPRALAPTIPAGGWFCPATSPPTPVPLSAPSAVAPGDLVAPGPTLNTLTPALTWTGVANATGYVVAVRNVAAGVIVYPSASGVGPPITGTTVTLPTGVLVAGTPYRWDVTAVNATSQSPASANRYFTTAAPVATVTVEWLGPIWSVHYAADNGWFPNATVDTVTVCAVITRADSSRKFGSPAVLMRTVGDSSTFAPLAGQSIAQRCGPVIRNVTAVADSERVVWSSAWLSYAGRRYLRPVAGPP